MPEIGGASRNVMFLDVFGSNPESVSWRTIGFQGVVVQVLFPLSESKVKKISRIFLLHDKKQWRESHSC